MNTLFADAVVIGGGGSGSGLIHQLFVVLIIGICALLLWAAGRWVIAKIAAPAIVMTIWTGFFLLLGLIVVLNFLLGTVGHSFLSY
jgi:hypothetical protein